MQQKSQFIIRQQLSNPDKYSLDAGRQCTFQKLLEAFPELLSKTKSSGKFPLLNASGIVYNLAAYLEPLYDWPLIFQSNNTAFKYFSYLGDKRKYFDCKFHSHQPNMG